MKPDARTERRAAIRKRLRRIAGQVAGLQRMLEEDRYCVDILTQLAAVRSALDAVGVELIGDHIKHCVAGDHDADGDAGKARAHPQARKRSADELAEELRVTLSRFLR